MPIHPFEPLRGRLDFFDLKSPGLANLQGDPTTRRVWIYLPESYDEERGSYPLFVDLVGFTGTGPAHINWKGFQQNVPQRLDALLKAGAMGKVICAFPDCFTSLGGNQYVDSLALGNWATWLTAEMIPAIEDRYRVRKGREHRAVFGKSSGGYGALYHGLRYAGHWGAIACHSGDMAFELAYARDFPALLMTLEKHGGLEGFLTHIESCEQLSGGDYHQLMALAMAASYDPDPHGPRGIRLPVDPRTCALIEERWQAWLAFDPLLMVEEPESQAALGSLSGIYIDCGSADQYALQFGFRRMVDRLSALGLKHHSEEFAGTHSHIDHRMMTSLPWLYEKVG